MKGKKLYRSESDRVLCGVCAGIAEYFDIDPTLVRLGWILLSLAGLFGMIFDKEVSATTLALVFAVFGYLIAKKRYDKTHPAVTEDTVEDSPAGSSEPDGE